MSRKGNCYDNAPMESFFKSFKVEEVYRSLYQTHEKATRGVAGYIERFTIELGCILHLSVSARSNTKSSVCGKSARRNKIGEWRSMGWSLTPAERQQSAWRPTHAT